MTNRYRMGCGEALQSRFKMATWPESTLMKLRPLNYPSGIRYIVIHCTATRADQHINIHTIDEWHRKRGWIMAGYHHVITRAGDVQNGRPYDKAGAHVAGHNSHSLGIALCGGLDENNKPADNYTSEQKAALVMVLRSLKVLCPQAEILGHRDLSPDQNDDGVIDRWEWVKDCPCFDVRQWCESVGVDWWAK